MSKIEKPWTMSIDEVCAELATDKENRLSSEGAAKQQANGRNVFKAVKPVTFWSIFLEEIREPMIILLLVVGVVYSIFGNAGDAITIFIIILVLAFVEVYTEFRAKKNIESLCSLGKPTAWVKREGRAVNIKAEDIVTGDILILNTGDMIMADARLISIDGLQVSEAQLTGESQWIIKTTDVIAEADLAERRNMVFSGATVMKGRAAAIVTAIGMDSELGKIAGLTLSAKPNKTPLQKAMKQLSRTLAVFALFFSVVIPLVAWLRGMPWREALVTGFSLAFATIPEELPIIITMVLGLSAIKLSKKNVLIKKLNAAETLGCVNVIATDKTGTITENKMTLEKLVAADEKSLLTVCGVLSDITGEGESSTGDPIDIAVLNRAEHTGLTEAIKKHIIKQDFGFDTDTKTITRDIEIDGIAYTYIKGAPESIIALTGNDSLYTEAETLTKDGYRVIAAASRKEGSDAYSFEGFVCFNDPVREGVTDAVRICTEAGIRIIMITGDHLNTAVKVAELAGIKVTDAFSGDDISKLTKEELQSAVRTANVFARITPAQKLDIVTALKANGDVVAVTGDGINDAPALKSADIGLAMGKSGTDIAKDAADMILADDSFNSIAQGVKEGRKLYANLHKCVKYYLACKVGLVLSFLIPLIIGIPLPFSAVQIILLELFMDVGASTSFVIEGMERDMMKLKPRSAKESFMNRSTLFWIFGGGITLVMIIMTVYLFAYYAIGTEIAGSLAFAAWLIGHIFLALNMRTETTPLIKNVSVMIKNRAFNIWAAAIGVFMVLIYTIKPLSGYLDLTSIKILQVLAITGVSLIITLWMEIIKLIKQKV